jgi:hypothetical protein
VPSLLETSTFVGGAVLVWSAFCLAVPPRRLHGVVIGVVGLLSGTCAGGAYTLHNVARGVDIDAIPHERAAQWFVAAFGWGGVAAGAALLLVPRLRERLAAGFRTTPR